MEVLTYGTLGVECPGSFTFDALFRSKGEDRDEGRRGTLLGGRENRRGCYVAGET